MSEVRGSSREELPRVRDRGQRLGGPTPRQRPGAVARRSNPTFQGAVAARAQEGLEELFHVQSQKGQQ